MILRHLLRHTHYLCFCIPQRSASIILHLFLSRRWFKFSFRTTPDRLAAPSRRIRMAIFPIIIFFGRSSLYSGHGGRGEASTWYSYAPRVVQTKAGGRIFETLISRLFVCLFICLFPRLIAGRIWLHHSQLRYNSDTIYTSFKKIHTNGSECKMGHTYKSTPTQVNPSLWFISWAVRLRTFSFFVMVVGAKWHIHTPSWEGVHGRSFSLVSGGPLPTQTVNPRIRDVYVRSSFSRDIFFEAGRKLWNLLQCLVVYRN